MGSTEANSGPRYVKHTITTNLQTANTEKCTLYFYSCPAMDYSMSLIQKLRDFRYTIQTLNNVVKIR